jgi:hypothetical protein
VGARQRFTVETILTPTSFYISYWDEFDSLTYARSCWRRKNAIWPTAGLSCAGTASDFASGAMLPLPDEPNQHFHAFLIFYSLSYMSTLHSDSTHRPNNSTPIHHNPNTSRLQKVSARFRGLPPLVQAQGPPVLWLFLHSYWSGYLIYHFRTGTAQTFTMFPVIISYASVR